MIAWPLRFSASSPVWRALWECLTEGEQIQADRRQSERVRQDFVAARAGLRMTLASYLNTSPRTLNFSLRPSGKPELASGLDAPSCHFNHSNSAGLGILAVCKDAAIGVDIEAIKPLTNAVQLSRRYFADSETAQISAAAANDGCAGIDQSFFHFWTAKEACWKQVGRGLAGGLDRFVFDLDHLKAAAAMRSIELSNVTPTHVPSGLGPPAAWTVVTFAMSKKAGFSTAQPNTAQSTTARAIKARSTTEDIPAASATTASHLGALAIHQPTQRLPININTSWGLPFADGSQ